MVAVNGNRLAVVNPQSMTVPEWKLVAVSRVKPAPHNPSGRTAPGKLKALVRSMADVGILYPILIDKTNTVIDGHRRLASAVELGWETIPAIVVEGDPADLYASVNETARRMSGNDALTVWLENRRAVSARLGKTFAEMADVVGLGMVRKMAARGLTAWVYDAARRVTRYCGDTSPEFTRATLEWLLEVSPYGVARQALAEGVPAEKIRNAVKARKPLRLQAE